MNRTQIILAIICLTLVSVGVAVVYKMRIVAPTTPVTPGHSNASDIIDTKHQDDPVDALSWPLADGTEVRGLGQFHDAPAENGMHTYNSEKLGISFNYPNTHLLFENRSRSESGIHVEMVSIVLDSSVRELIAYPAARALPPSIRFNFYAEPNTAVSLEEWIRSHSESNFDPAYVSPPVLTPTTVAGAPSFSYRVVGMYDTEYVAFRYGEWIVLATSDEADERARRDFQAILSSIQLK